MSRNGTTASYLPAILGLVGSFAILPAVVLWGSRYAGTETMCRTVAHATKHPAGAIVVGATVGALGGHAVHVILDEWRTP